MVMLSDITDDATMKQGRNNQLEKEKNVKTLMQVHAYKIKY